MFPIQIYVEFQKSLIRILNNSNTIYKTKLNDLLRTSVKVINNFSGFFLFSFRYRNPGHLYIPAITGGH